MSADRYIQEQAQIAVDRVLASRLNEFADKIVERLGKPEYESWGRYLTLQQAMVYAGYESKGGLNGFLDRYEIRKIKHSAKDVRVDRYEIDRGMRQEFINEHLKTIAA